MYKNPFPRSISSLTETSSHAAQADAYAWTLGDIVEHLRLKDGALFESINIHGNWSWVIPHPDLLLGVHSNDLTNLINKVAPTPMGQRYSIGDASDLVNQWLNFDDPRYPVAKYKPWIFVGFVCSSHLRTLVSKATEIDPFSMREHQGDQNTFVLDTTQSTVEVTCLGVSSMAMPSSSLYFYAQMLAPILRLTRLGENVLLYLEPAQGLGTGQRQQLGLVGHNWRATIALRPQPSQYDRNRPAHENYTIPKLQVHQKVDGKKLRKNRRLTTYLFPYEKDLLAFLDVPVEANPIASYATSAPVIQPAMVTKSTTPDQAIEMKLRSSIEREKASREALLSSRPPFPAARRLEHLDAGETFLRITPQMIKNQRIDAHPDHICFAGAYPLTLATTVPGVTPSGVCMITPMRPVETWSSIINTYIVLELPSNAWVLPYNPPSPVEGVIIPHPGRNPHNYQTTEGLKHRLNKSIF